MKKSFFLTWIFLTGLAGICLFPCTIFNADRGGLVLAGNNEDLMTTDSRIWFHPPSGGRYGYVYVGFDSCGIQGGMNDRGLFFDYNALKFAQMKPSPGKLKIKSWRKFVDKIMEECATVGEVVSLLEKYNLGWWGPNQVMYADATGASAVIGADKNGELSVVWKQGDYQVSTNFSLANPEFGSSTYPCSRYEIAGAMLQEMKDLTVDYFRKILAAIHQEGPYPTVYSNICDLTSKEIYLYNFHNFEEAAKFNLEEEFEKGEHSYEIASLFPRKTHAQRSFEEAQEEALSGILLRKILKDGRKAAIRQFHDIKGEYSLVPSELDKLIFFLRLKGRLTDMIEITRLYTREFPDSAKGHKRLADIYLRLGNKKRAIEGYKKVLGLEPGNKEVIGILKRIEK